MYFFFFFNDTATTEIYTLSLHDALPIFESTAWNLGQPLSSVHNYEFQYSAFESTAWNHGLLCRGYDSHFLFQYRSEEHTSELQSRHISYAVFCLKKKKSQKPHSILSICI